MCTILYVPTTRILYHIVYIVPLSTPGGAAATAVCEDNSRNGIFLE